MIIIREKLNKKKWGEQKLSRESFSRLFIRL